MGRTDETGKGNGGRRLSWKRRRSRGGGSRSDQGLGGANWHGGAECGSSLSGKATLFGSNQSFGWMLRGNSIRDRGEIFRSGRCGCLLKIFNSDGTIRETNMVGFDIGLP